jgi:hypothetical protein
MVPACKEDNIGSGQLEQTEDTRKPKKLYPKIIG